MTQPQTKRLADELTQQFQLGETVWMTDHQSQRQEIVCWACEGGGEAAVVLPNGETFQMACPECGQYQGGEYRKRGTGRIERNIASSKVVESKITEIKFEWGKYSYKTNLWSFDCQGPFKTKEEAEAALTSEESLRLKRAAQRLHEKKEANRSWSWHVHYHRDCIRRAERDLEHHREKLGIAQSKAKEPKEVKP